MKVYLANFAFFPPREYGLRQAGARRLISYVDPSRDQTVGYWRAPLVVPKPAKRRIAV